MIFLSHAELVSTGPIGVSLFLALSGFCMTYAYFGRPEKTPEPSVKNSFRFAGKKVRKLYPLHLVTLLFVALVIFGGLVARHASGRELAEQGGYFIANALLLQSWIPWRDGYFSFNAVSWYLSTTAFSYFLFPQAFRAIRSGDGRRIAHLAAAALCSMIAVAVLLGVGVQRWGWSRDFVKWAVYICPLYRAGDFILGLAAGYLFVTRKSGWSPAQHTAAEIAVLLLMAVQVALYHSGMLKAENWSLTLFWLPTSLLCVWLFAVGRGAVSRLLSRSRALVWLGNISGEAFLIHQICIKAAEYGTQNRWLVAAAAFVVTLLAAVVWRWLYQMAAQKTARRA